MVAPSANWDEVQGYVKLFYPQYFDPNSPHYVDPDILAQLDALAQTTRPYCLSEQEQNMAEAWFLAYLISLRNETVHGQSVVHVAGPVVSEKEGDIAVQYADLTAVPGNTLSQRPSNDPYDAWLKLWNRCGRAAIITRYGDPCRPRFQQATLVVNPLRAQAFGVWNGYWPGL